MKNLILLLVLTITLISCDTHSDPTIYTEKDTFEVLNNSDNLNMSSPLRSKYESIPTKGKKSYGYIDDGHYYFITEDGHYYKAVLASNTDIIHISFLSFIITIFIFFGAGFILSKSIYD